MALVVRWLGCLPLEEALILQEQAALECAAGHETVLLLEHKPVYTTGRGGAVAHLPDAAHAGELPVHRLSRGGDATYHGPGQLVGWVIVDLRRRAGDAHRHLRALEEALLQIGDAFELATTRRPGLTGVWTRSEPPRKLGSIGIGVRRGVTRHGFALNVRRGSLAGFRAIVPCGLAGVEMTSLESECPGREITVTDAVRVAEPILRKIFEIRSRECPARS